jgi:hypothetical protein
VLIFVGRNKIVPDLEAAIARIKNYAAPVNVMRLDKKSPCGQTGHCENCSSPDRICNTWTIIEKSFPKHRVKVVLDQRRHGILRSTQQKWRFFDTRKPNYRKPRNRTGGIRRDQTY